MRKQHAGRSSARFTGTQLGLLIGIVACSDPASPGAASGGMNPSFARESGQGEEQVYVANLSVLNARAQTNLDPDPADGAHGVAHGKATFTIAGGNFSAAVDAAGAEPGMIHPQHIHAADRCPTAAADVNNDGFVDVIEGLPFYGAILIPLDSDVGSQAVGTFPTASGPKGLLAYSATTPLATLLADLNATDPNPADAVVKLGGAPLALETRHVVLHGVDVNTFLPPSVASLPGLPAQLTLPIACGEIRSR